MFHALEPLTPAVPEFKLKTAFDDFAVAQCQLSWERGYRAEMKLTKSPMLARKEAREAFRQALPPLSGLEEIAGYIACVAYAISTGVFVNGDEAELLHAAQAALHLMALQLKRR